MIRTLAKPDSSPPKGGRVAVLIAGAINQAL
jgi:hypothetical protein